MHIQLDLVEAPSNQDIIDFQHSKPAEVTYR
jgi:hypothetical protein